MKKVKYVLKTIILIPMFPLIWKQLGFKLHAPRPDYCEPCSYGGCECYDRAVKMIAWRNR